MLRDLLRREGFEVGRKHVATPMRKRRIKARCQKPRTTGCNREHPVFSYLLRGVAIERPNHVWTIDTTYISMRRGFVYLTTAVVDWASRRVLAFRVSISLALTRQLTRSTTRSRARPSGDHEHRSREPIHG